jgi:hypothetical protein
VERNTDREQACCWLPRYSLLGYRACPVIAGWPDDVTERGYPSVSSASWLVTAAADRWSAAFTDDGSGRGGPVGRAVAAAEAGYERLGRYKGEDRPR